MKIIDSKTLNVLTGDISSQINSSLEPVKSMLSTEIATLTGKRHDNVIRDIETIVRQLKEDSSDLSSGFESSSYLAGNGKQEKCYILNYEATMIVMTGYDVVARAKVIKRWQELEKQEVERTKLLIDTQTAINNYHILQLSEQITNELDKSPSQVHIVNPITKPNSYHHDTETSIVRSPVLVPLPETPNFEMKHPSVYRSLDGLSETLSVSTSNIKWHLYNSLFTEYDGTPLESASGYYKVGQKSILWSIEFVVKLLIHVGLKSSIDARAVDYFAKD